MSNISKILPSDRNEMVVIEELNSDGSFEVNVPYTDASRRDRKMSLDKFYTTQPFIPSHLWDYFDHGDESFKSKFNEVHILELDPKKFGDSGARAFFSDLVPEEWKNFSVVKEKLEKKENLAQKDWLVNWSYFCEQSENLFNKARFLNLDDYIQVFAEVGNKVSRKTLEEQSVDAFDMDVLKMYLFHKDFFVPPMELTSAEPNSAVLSVGERMSISMDDKLRSMIRFAMFDVNKGDVRRSYFETGRSMYFEYLTDDKEYKYVWVWTLGNPLLCGGVEVSDFWELQWPLGKNHQPMPYYKANTETESLFFGRKGTFLSLVDLKIDNAVGNSFEMYIMNLLMDVGYVLTSQSRYDNEFDNLVVCIFRSNFAFVAIMMLVLSLSYDFPKNFSIDRKEGNKAYVRIIEKRSLKSIWQDILAFMCGQITDLNSSLSVRDLLNLRYTMLYGKPSIVSSIYADSFILKLVCEQGETSVTGSNKKRRNQQILALLTANETTYQQFLNIESKISIQAPTFRPLTLLAPEETLILRNSNKLLTFRILNLNDEPIKVLRGDKVVMRLKFEAVD